MNESSQCAKCGDYALEHLPIRSVCWECGYRPDFESELSQWERLEYPRLGVLRGIKPIRPFDQVASLLGPWT